MGIKSHSVVEKLHFVWLSIFEPPGITDMFMLPLFVIAVHCKFFLIFCLVLLFSAIWQIKILKYLTKTIIMSTKC